MRDEKTLLGVGQAQVRCSGLVETAPALTVASYALLPPPKWASTSPSTRTSTQQALHQLRAEVWGRGLGLDHLSGFASSPGADAKPEKCSFPLASAVCYANA